MQFVSKRGGGGVGYPRGWYTDEATLIAAMPEGRDGRYAIVEDTGTMWIWDESTSAWIDTGNLITGVTNPDGTPISDGVYILDEDGNKVGVQTPFQVDGDSVYEKDIRVSTSIVTDWTDLDSTGKDIVTIPFNNLHTRIQNVTSNNPKIIRIHLNRTVNAQQVGLGSYGGGDFSNVKIVLLGSGEVEREVKDDSLNNTKYTSRNYEFEPQLFNAIRLEFHTTDTVTISNITVQKAINVNSQIRGLRPDGTTGDVNVTNGNNLKISLEEFETAFFDANPLPVNITNNFYLEVAKGNITGHSVIHKFGQNNSLNTATYEDIWDGGGTYVYPADGTAPITHLISDTTDVQPIEVQGLDINGDLVIQTITLTGTTLVALTTPLWRVFRLMNVGTLDLTDNACATNSTDTQDYACIDNGNNQTLMALYTIPNGYTGYLLQGTNNLSEVTRGVSVSGRLMMRPYGMVFQLKKTFGVDSDGSGYINVPNIIPAKIPAKTDIRVSAISSANGVTINTTLEILLIED